MLGNTINGYVQGGPDKALGAALTLLLAAFLLVFMLYYLREPARRRAREAPPRTRGGDLGLRALVAAAGAAGDPVRVQPGRSRTSPQGWSLRWFWTDPTLSVRHDPTLWTALRALAGAGRAARC